MTSANKQRVRGAELRLREYGNFRDGHEQVGKMWTALLEAHYGTKLTHELPGYMVALMMSALKLRRAAYGASNYIEDNYIDGVNYLEFAKAMASEEVSNEDDK